MTDSLQASDDAAAAAAATTGGRRVTLDDIKANVAAEFYMTGQTFAAYANVVDEPAWRDAFGPDRFGPGSTASAGVVVGAMGSLRTLTICVVVLRNGFTVIGKSAPADETNFNPDLGRKFAREDAIRQCWPLMGYALKEWIAQSRAAADTLAAGAA